ncbi:ORF6N domain-containing protein [Massilibacteroides sp.]|uniref:ORF6N domain-containing protein n=1 Tax=Massilibacteroides sp. TaxID=2034766 RepID=UPI00260345D0|nr:ORF6N domain-containing protein [Massilibacteroides sp.]MDD4514733.1 ORF6N domain-containing protein [Massilibacteroides sp.]
MELQIIQNKIYEIRGQRVILDFDLANMYQVETRVLNQAVKRNIERFPEDFMFQLTPKEWESMSSQIVMTSINKRPKVAIPFAFTEHGVVMLASLLRSNIAVQTSILITRAFVAMRQLVLNSPSYKVEELQHEIRELKQYIEDVFTDYNDINENTQIQLDLINETLAELQVKNKELKILRKPVGYITPSIENE